MKHFRSLMFILVALGGTAFSVIEHYRSAWVLLFTALVLLYFKDER